MVFHCGLIRRQTGLICAILLDYPPTRHFRSQQNKIIDDIYEIIISIKSREFPKKYVYNF